MGLVLTIILLDPTLTLGADWYIDPTAPCPGSGTPVSPWCKYPETFNGGDTYRQRAGTTYHGQIRILKKYGTTPNAPLIFTSYGIGDRPIIYAMNKIDDEWHLTPEKRWTQLMRAPYDMYTSVLTSNGVRLKGPIRGFGANVEQQLCTTAEWHFDPTEQMIISCIKPVDPQGNQTNVKTGRPTYGFQLQDAVSNILIDGFKFIGGLWQIDISDGVSNVEIRNNDFGEMATNGVKLRGNTARPITNIHIHHNFFDTRIRWGDLGYENNGTDEGVMLSGHVQNSVIEHNKFIAWGHNGVYIYARQASRPATGNVIRFNEFHCGTGSTYWEYCRPMGIDGDEENAARDNVISGNYYHDYTLGVQFNGNNNIFENNRCYNNYGPPSFSTSLGKTCIVMSTYEVSKDNLIRNNEFAYSVAFFQYGSVSGQILSGHQIIGNYMAQPVRWGYMLPEWVDFDSIKIQGNHGWPPSKP